MSVGFRGDSLALAVAIQANGKIVVVGEDKFKFGVARFKSDGTLDRSFGGDGEVITGFDGSAARPTPLQSRRTGRSSSRGRTIPAVAVTTATLLSPGTGATDRSIPPSVSTAE